MKKLAFVLVALFVLLGVTGCWDNRELDTLFIVTALGLDAAENEEEVGVSVQIVRVSDGNSGGSSGSGGGEDGGSSILLEASGKSVLAAVSTLRHESTRSLYLHHNQMIIFGREVAIHGIQHHLDLFLRDEETRMETLVLVAQDKAKDVIDAELNQDKLSGIAVTRMMQQYANTSKYLSVNMLNLVSKILQKTTSPLIPMVEVIKEEDKEKLNISKMAVLKGDRMVGELSWEEVTGYLWAMGEINEGILEIATENGTVAMSIIQASSKTVPVLQPDGAAGVIMEIDTTLDIEELNGFGDMKMEELHSMLIKEATQAIEQRVYTTFDKTRQMNTDIYGYGGMYHIKYPKQWESLEQQWDAIYPALRLVLNVKTHIVGTGKTAITLDMEEKKK